jgi:hypothetical protein
VKAPVFQSGEILETGGKKERYVLFDEPIYGRLWFKSSGEGFSVKNLQRKLNASLYLYLNRSSFIWAYWGIEGVRVLFMPFKAL